MRLVNGTATAKEPVLDVAERETVAADQRDDLERVAGATPG